MNGLTLHLAPGAFAAIVLGAGPACAQAHDGTYSGTIICDSLTGVTKRQVVTEFRMVVTGAAARFERDVLNSTNNAPSGIKERGTGSVAPDGTVALVGAANGVQFAYEARYGGKLTAGVGKLTGSQHWLRTDVQGAIDRPCTIEIRRGG